MFIQRINLIQWGDSYGIKIEKEILKQLDIEDENIEFSLEVSAGKIILTPAKEYPQTIEEAFEDYDGKPLGSKDKYDWGNPSGRELS